MIDVRFWFSADPCAAEARQRGCAHEAAPAAVIRCGRACWPVAQTRKPA